MESKATLGSIQKAVWAGTLPLHITLAPSESRTFDQTDPYLVRPLLVPDELELTHSDLLSSHIILTIASPKAESFLRPLLD